MFGLVGVVVVGVTVVVVAVEVWVTRESHGVSTRMGHVAARHTVQLQEGEFSYLELGQGDPVVFLHALGRSASDWLPIMEAMQSDWGVSPSTNVATVKAFDPASTASSCWNKTSGTSWTR